MATLTAQSDYYPAGEQQLDSLYQANITKSRINDIYIPRNLKDAHRRLERETPADAKSKFKAAEDGKEVSKKLHYGIGRWMIVNWNFYEGSRLSHSIKKMGVSHPDDIAQFILRTFHNYLNERPLDEEKIIKELLTERKKEIDYLIRN